MGAFTSKSNGISNAIIGTEELAKEPLPDENDPRWTKNGEISNLYIYPVKSFRGIPVSSCQIGKHGLSNGPLKDRQFLGKLIKVDCFL